MARIGTSAATDYKFVDGVESITLSDGTNSITVAYANRGVLSAKDQLTGDVAGSCWWLLPIAEVSGDIARPYPGHTITDSDNAVWIVNSVGKLVISGMWQCMCTAGV